MINNKQAQLNCKVNETNVKEYEFQQSTEGTNFIGIGILFGKGDGINNYQFTEQKTLNGSSYYRIKQIDFDGKFSYPALIRLYLSGMSLLTIYPNPFKNKININSSKIQTASLIDAHGRQVRQ